VIELDRAFYSPSEVGALLRVSSDTILNYIRSGRIEGAIKLSERTYRIPQRQVARLLGQSVAASTIARRAHGGRAAAAAIRRGTQAERTPVAR